jgi:2',3'-cyclic-nucleotide 2'-phosphodiesterase (5'-nucleotidase family)
MHDEHAASADEQPRLRILGYSDLENAYDDPARVGAFVDLLERHRDERTLVVGAGDDTALGTLALLTDESRAQALPFFEAVEPAADTFGNHDFDHGSAWAGEWADRVPATYCCANVAGPEGDSDEDESIGGVPDGIVVDRDGHEVGIVGVAHPETADICGTVDDLEFGDPVAAANAALDDLGPVDYRVVLAHCGAEDPTVAAGVDADVVLGGHLHSCRVERFDETLLVRTAGGGTELVEVTLGGADRDDRRATAEFHEVDSASSDPKSSSTAEVDGGRDGPGGGRTVAGSNDEHSTVESGEEYPVAESSVRDPTAASLAATYRERRAALGVDEVVTHVEDPLVRTEHERFGGESRVGNFAADAMRASAGAQLGLFPGGSVRTGDPLAGAVTVGDVVAVCPFGGPVVELALTGRELRTVLEEAAHPHPGDRGWVQFHVSGGRVVWTDENELARATVDGEAIAPDRTYRVGAPEYVVTIDAFGPLGRDNVVAECVEQWRAIVGRARNGGLAVECEGRIERVPAESVVER